MLTGQPRWVSSWASQEVLGLLGVLYYFLWKLDKNQGIGLWDRCSALYALCSSVPLQPVHEWFQGRYSKNVLFFRHLWRIDCKWIISTFFSFSSFGPSHFRNINHPVPYSISSLALLRLRACLFRMSNPWDDVQDMGSQERLLARLFGWSCRV